MAERLELQFDDLVQQRSAATLGIWLFIATEVLLFGGLLLAYTVYRISYPQEFAQAGSRLDVTIGTINTALLLTSSFTMALAVSAARQERRWRTAGLLGMTAFLGVSFLALKAVEYQEDIAKHLGPGLFMFLYYALTGLHALHLTIGTSILFALISKAILGRDLSRTQVEVTGLYWHFVDIVWIFLYPLLYLMERTR